MSASPTSASQSRLIEMSEMKGDDERIPKFLKAASQRDLNNMRELLASGVKASGADYDKRTALHLAASEGHIEAVRLLVENGANLNAIDRFGHTPLDDAISHHHDKVADFLRSFSAEVGDKRQYENALIQAAFQNNTEEAARLLQNGVNVNSVDYDRRTALHLAVAERHENMVKLLLQYNADPQAEDRWGNTPASEAIRHAKRMGDDPILAAFASVVEHMHTDAPLFNKFVVFLFSWEIAMIILIGLFVRYGPAAAGGVDPSNFLDAMYNSYPLYQDVHVMIFVGFGFLMTFLRKNAYMSLALTFLIGAFSIQWFVLNEGFWAGVFTGSFHMVEVDVKLLTRADFAAGAVLISYGVVLGKVSPLQVMVMTMFEVIVYSLNEQIGLKLGVADLGGSMVIHLFGAVFGLTATKLLTKPGAMGRPDASAGYHADIFSMIGTVFLWMYWPSFNGALGLGNTQHRAVINTVLSLSAACTVAFVMSNFMRREGRFNMVDIQNATLAGGVAMGTCADMIIYPGGAVAIGCIAGVVSVAGFAFIQPYFERKFGIHDTCGVLNLHFMPSVLGAMAGFIASYRANVDDYGADQLSYIFAERGGADPRGSSSQALFQFIYFVITIGIALVSGFLAGVILRLPFFEAPDADDTFHDDIYFEVPPVETPYYFDKRGEVIRGPGSGAYELDNLTAGSDARAVDMFIKRLEARIVLLESNAAKAVKSEQAAGRVEEVFERLLAKLDKPHTN